MPHLSKHRRRSCAVALALLSLVGCTREVSQPERADPVAPAPLPPADETDGASPVFGWTCRDGARLVTRYDGSTGVLELATETEVDRLEATRAASGARWAGDGVAFHNQGDEARLTRGAATTACEIDPVATAEARAAAAGVILRGLGAEGDWSLEIEADRLRWIGAFGAERRRFLDPVRAPGEGARWYGQDALGSITVAVDDVPCRDESGRSFPASMTVELGDISLEGCGRWLEPVF